MGTLIMLMFLAICVILGFNGMPLLLVFPGLFLLMLIIFAIDAVKQEKNPSKTKIHNKYNSNNNIEELEDNTLEEHFMFTEMTDDHK